MIQARRDYLIKGTVFGNVFDDHIGKLLLRDVRMRFEDVLALFFRPDCNHRLKAIAMME